MRTIQHFRRPAAVLVLVASVGVGCNSRDKSSGSGGNEREKEYAVKDIAGKWQADPETAGGVKVFLDVQNDGGKCFFSIPMEISKSRQAYGFGPSQLRHESGAKFTFKVGYKNFKDLKLQAVETDGTLKLRLTGTVIKTKKSFEYTLVRSKEQPENKSKSMSKNTPAG